MADELLLPGPLTRAEGLAIFRGALHGEEFDALTATDEGLATVVGIVDTFVDLSSRLDRNASSRHLVTRRSDVSPIASGAVAATVELELRRATASTGQDVNIPSGTVAQTVDGHRYTLDAAVYFGAGDRGPLYVNATAVVPGFASTVIAGSIDRFAELTLGASGDLGSVIVDASGTYLEREAGDQFFDRFLGCYVEFTTGANAGRIVQILAVVTGDRVELDTSGGALTAESLACDWIVREWADLGFTVAQLEDTSQGLDASLDDLALEVGRLRQVGESDDTLTTALLAGSDAVSPLAIIRLANRALGTLGPVRMYEVGTPATEATPVVGFENLEAFPGMVADAYPADVPQEGLLDVDDSVLVYPPEPPRGLACASPLWKWFLLRWDGAGLEDPGAFALDSLGVEVLEDAPLDVPAACAADVSPADGSPFGDDAIRASVGASVDKIRGHGVAWSWFPRYFPVPV